MPGFNAGFAIGLQNADEMGLKRDQLAAETSARNRGLDLQERGLDQQLIGMQNTERRADREFDLRKRQAATAEHRAALERADKGVNDTVALISDTITKGLAANRDAGTIAKAVRPLIDSAKELAARAGRDPDQIEARVAAAFANPTGRDISAAEGVNKATAAVAENKGLAEGGIVKTDKDKSQLENSLRDDYTKIAGDFIKIRDAKNRIDSVESTGAGDVALVFQYMKILDPTSTVREGEFATASNAAGVPAAVSAMYNKAVGGGLLDEKGRREIKAQAKLLYNAQERQFKTLESQFRTIAERQGLNPQNVILDFNPVNVPVPDGTPAPPPGFIINPKR